MVGANRGWSCPKTGHFRSTNADFTCSETPSARKRNETVSHAGEIFLSDNVAFIGWQRVGAIAVREQYRLREIRDETARERASESGTHGGHVAHQDHFHGRRTALRDRSFLDGAKQGPVYRARPLWLERQHV